MAKFMSTCARKTTTCIPIRPHGPVFLTLAAILALLLYGGCTTTPNAPLFNLPTYPATQGSYTINDKTYHLLTSADDYWERGRASWYGEEFHGRVTANGEVFDMYAMTAAHKTLPMNTILLVRNLKNGKKALVRINDRGPFFEDRIIDLSYRAARRIGMIDSGVASIEIITLGKIAPPDPIIHPEATETDFNADDVRHASSLAVAHLADAPGESGVAAEEDLCSECGMDFPQFAASEAARVAVDFSEGRYALGGDSPGSREDLNMLSYFIGLFDSVIERFRPEEPWLGVHICHGDSVHSADAASSNLEGKEYLKIGKTLHRGTGGSQPAYTEGA